MSRTAFENLRVYQLGEQLADEIWNIVTGWSILARDTIGKQVIRAADGIGANIAEGTGRGTFPDNRRFVRIARGSLYETKHWLRRAFRRNLLTAENVTNLRAIMDELAPKLNAYLKSIGKGRAANSKTDVPPPNPSSTSSQEHPDEAIDRRATDNGQRTTDKSAGGGPNARATDNGQRTTDRSAGGGPNARATDNEQRTTDKC